MSSGRFITIEGGEGVGKTVFSKMLIEQLGRLKIEIVKTFEPGGTPMANQLREMFLKPSPAERFTMEAEFCLVCAARALHVATVVKPAIAENKWVLCDRYIDSSRVYQGAIGGVEPDFLNTVNKFASFDVIPDITFLLDCDVEVSLQRLGKRSDSGEDESRFDQANEAFHQKVRAAYLELAKQYSERIVILSADRDPEAIVGEALSIIKKRLLN